MPLLVEDKATHHRWSEIKCPTPKTHVLWLDGILPTEYRQQVHGSMAITGLNTWHFWSFYPGLQPLHVGSTATPGTEGLNEVLNRFIDDCAAAYAAALPNPTTSRRLISPQPTDFSYGQNQRHH